MTKKTDPFKYSFDRLEDVADQISDVLECPITIEDIHHRLLAYSTHNDFTDPARTSTIISRRVPEKVINRLWKDGIIPTLLKTDEPLRVNQIAEVGLSSRIAISIWKDKEVLGFIWAIESPKPFTDEEMDLLKMAANAVKNKLIHLQIRKSKTEERNQELFWKMLTGHIREKEEMTDLFLRLGLRCPDTYAIIIIRLRDELDDETEKKLSYLLETTQQVQVLLTTVDFHELIILVSPKTDHPLQDMKQFTNSLLHQLSDRYKIHDAQAAIGGIYDNITNIQPSYREAQAVLKTKERFPNETERFISFSELGIYQYLDVLAEKRKHSSYSSYSLSKLEDYDLRHHSNLVETLERFIDCDSNANIAAQQLNIHINTLNYRLKRITDIAEIDLKNINEKMTIYLDMKLKSVLL
ncbi:PucR family transcriptional regulator [Bacillus sp. NPDC077027]|uniref:PucR family transcriptional regulator n=1 Tax=Bacillus sp. NPDC077027 TaxID=3390548 RepID=UPI003D04C3FD